MKVSICAEHLLKDFAGFGEYSGGRQQSFVAADCGGRPFAETGAVGVRLRQNGGQNLPLCLTTPEARMPWFPILSRCCGPTNCAQMPPGSMALGNLLHHARRAALAQRPGANPKALLNWRRHGSCT